MGKATALPRAVPMLLAALVLMSCLAASSSSCIPRRLLVVSRPYYWTAPCNDDLIDGPTHRGSRGGGNDGKAEPSGSRIPWRPPSPIGGRPRAAGTTAPPGSNN
ncbi:hypothetical protein BS78_01G108100 [Paspalum vaginatum]|nr:hypothetical protein BS78_01G108100 [Paspalum vaginatum]